MFDAQAQTKLLLVVGDVSEVPKRSLGPALWFVGGLFIVGIGVYAAIASWPDGLILFVLFLSLGCWLLLSSRSKVEIDDRTLLVVNTLRTHSISIAEIDCIWVRSGKIFPLSPLVELKDGTKVSLKAYTPLAWYWPFQKSIQAEFLAQVLGVPTFDFLGR